MDGNESFISQFCIGNWVTDIAAIDLLRILQVPCTFVFEYIDCIIVSEYHALEWPFSRCLEMSLFYLASFTLSENSSAF